jgi:hypothetical protein
MLQTIKLSKYFRVVMALSLLGLSCVAFAVFPGDEDYYRYRRDARPDNFPDSFGNVSNSANNSNIQQPGSNTTQNAPSVVIVPSNDTQKLVKKMFDKADYKDLEKYDKPAIPFTIPTVNP